MNAPWKVFRWAATTKGWAPELFPAFQRMHFSTESLCIDPRYPHIAPCRLEPRRALRAHTGTAAVVLEAPSKRSKRQRNFLVEYRIGGDVEAHTPRWCLTDQRRMAPVDLLAQVQADLAQLDRIHDSLRSRTKNVHLYDRLLAVNDKIAAAKSQLDGNVKAIQELERDIDHLLLRRENAVLRARCGLGPAAASTPVCSGRRSASAAADRSSAPPPPPSADNRLDPVRPARPAATTPVTARSDEDEPVTQADLESVPMSMRGGAKVAHVNELLRAVRSYFRKHPKKSVLSLSDLVALVGARMAGRTGQCMIHVLRTLGYIDYEAKRGLSLTGRSRPPRS